LLLNCTFLKSEKSKSFSIIPIENKRVEIKLTIFFTNFSKGGRACILQGSIASFLIKIKHKSQEEKSKIDRRRIHKGV